MSTYTTGEIAKKCNVSVRTVQYYDSRGILSPESLTDGGRRLYCDEDVQKLKVICFLRDLGFSIHSIATFLTDKNAASTVSLLVEEQLSQVKRELAEQQSRLQQLETLSQAVKEMDTVSVDALYSIACTLQGKKKLRQARGWLLLGGLLLDLFEIASFLISLNTGMWWIFALTMVGNLALGFAFAFRYMRHTDYICPHCHHKFHPPRWKNLFAPHTPRTRKLSCPHCKETSYCVEVYAEGDKEQRNL